VGEKAVVSTGTCACGIQGAALEAKLAAASTRHLITSFCHRNPEGFQSRSLFNPGSARWTFSESLSSQRFLFML
jgi:hypothetical protein